MDLTIRPVVPEDEYFMAPLINAADGGIPLQIWATVAPPEEEAWEAGTLQVRIDDVFVFWRKAWIACASGKPAGLLLGYRLPDTPKERGQESVTPG